MSFGALDSKAVFAARLKAIDIPNAAIQTLQTAGIDTMAKLAFLSSCQPGVGDDSPFVKALAAALGYDDYTAIPAGLLSGMRRIWFESHTIAVSEVRQKLEKPEDQNKKLPLPEREVRRASQQARLAGVLIEGALEPSHGLIDLVFSMKDDELVRYIDPCNCTCRVQELSGVKREHFVRFDATSGNLKQVTKDVLGTTDVSSEYKLRLALQRRNLALDQLDVLPYEAGERYVNMLFELMQKTVPSAFSPITMEQIVIADRQVWLKMAEICRSGLSKDDTGKYPLETALTDSLRDPIVMSTLQPLPRSRAAPAHTPQHNKPPPRAAPYERPASKGGKGQKGRGKGKQQWRGPVPSALQGGWSRTKDRQPICFAYNLNGCSSAKAGEKCSKGLHVCCGCFSDNHTFSQCQSRK